MVFQKLRKFLSADASSKYPVSRNRKPDARLCYLIPTGIYYITSRPINVLPEDFTSREAAYYLAAIEILTDYKLAGRKLGFVVDWLKRQRDENGQWDMGAKVKDGIHFPLSDLWRKIEDRKHAFTVKTSFGIVNSSAHRLVGGG